MIQRVMEKILKAGGSGGVFTLFLYPLSLVYGLIVKTRFLLYRVGILKTEAVSKPVISIGNITVGGSGKTPLTIYIARHLRKQGKTVLILSRGYKRKGKGIEVVSDGAEMLLEPIRAGDEPYFIAKKLKDVPVVVGKDRASAALFAIERFSPDVFILDDGFQHIGLKRDMDIVLMDDKKGFGNGLLLPCGPLREPLAGSRWGLTGGLTRADVFMVKRSVHSKGGAGLFTEARGKPIFRFSYRPTALVDLNLEKIDAAKTLRDKKVIALCAVANPESFFDTLKSLGAVIKTTLAFPDHHWYGKKDIETIRKASSGTDLIVTTEKDAIRLKMCAIKGLDIKAISIEVEVQGEARFLELIDNLVGIPPQV